MGRLLERGSNTVLTAQRGPLLNKRYLFGSGHLLPRSVTVKLIIVFSYYSSYM